MLLGPGWEPPGRALGASAPTSDETGETHPRCGRDGLEQVQPGFAQTPVHGAVRGVTRDVCYNQPPSCSRVRAAAEINTRTQNAPSTHRPKQLNQSVRTHVAGPGHIPISHKHPDMRGRSAAGRATLWTEGSLRVTATSWGNLWVRQQRRKPSALSLPSETALENEDKILSDIKAAPLPEEDKVLRDGGLWSHQEARTRHGRGGQRFSGRTAFTALARTRP